MPNFNISFHETTSSRNLNIPGFRPLFLNQLNMPQALTHGVVRAMQFDKYDYEQVREGFPFRLEKPFATARSGYKAIWKFY